MGHWEQELPAVGEELDTDMTEVVHLVQELGEEGEDQKDGKEAVRTRAPGEEQSYTAGVAYMMEKGVVLLAGMEQGRAPEEGRHNHVEEAEGAHRDLVEGVRHGTHSHRVVAAQNRVQGHGLVGKALERSAPHVVCHSHDDKNREAVHDDEREEGHSHHSGEEEARPSIVHPGLHHGHHHGDNPSHHVHHNMDPPHSSSSLQEACQGNPQAALSSSYPCRTALVADRSHHADQRSGHVVLVLHHPHTAALPPPNSPYSPDGDLPCRVEEVRGHGSQGEGGHRNVALALALDHKALLDPALVVVGHDPLPWDPWVPEESHAPGAAVAEPSTPPVWCPSETGPYASPIWLLPPPYPQSTRRRNQSVWHSEGSGPAPPCLSCHICRTSP